jgi:hypothetical protein
MRGVAWRTGLILTALGASSTAALDVAIDRSGHDPNHPAFRYGRLPTRALFAGGTVLMAGAIGAQLIPGARSAAAPFARLGAATLGAWLATESIRYATGMLFSPRGRGVDFAPNDLARNAIDRIHMMGSTPRTHERVVLGIISELQGHGSYEKRLAAGDFMPPK